MKPNNFDECFWENRYKHHNTGWDLGTISTPLKSYIDQLSNYGLKILIPGGGYNYEAEYLWNKGFKNVFIIDIAKTPLDNFKQRVPDFPNQHIIHLDFFKLQGSFDLILEQTFFCALEPSLREAYACKMNQLLKPKAKLAGLLFNFELTQDGPPFGGSLKAYQKLFSKYFKIKTLEPAYNSIKPRRNKELFFIFEKTPKA